LEVTKNGKTTIISQSHAIERYLSRHFGFLGSTEEESGVIESIAEGVLDVVQAYMAHKRNTNKEESDKGIKQFFAETLPKHIGFFARFYEHNSHHNGWAVGEKISLADIAIYHLFDFFDDQESVHKALAPHPLLGELRERVHGLLSEWIARRPVTPF